MDDLPVYSAELAHPLADPIPDVSELRLILKEIDANPESWYQGQWATRNECGTSYCFAGHAVKRAGYEFDYTPGGVSAHTTTGEYATEVAQRILGLTGMEVLRLFNCDNTYEDLVRIVDTIAERAET